MLWRGSTCHVKSSGCTALSTTRIGQLVGNYGGITTQCDDGSYLAEMTSRLYLVAVTIPIHSQSVERGRKPIPLRPYYFSSNLFYRSQKAHKAPKASSSFSFTDSLTSSFEITMSTPDTMTASALPTTTALLLYTANAMARKTAAGA